MNSHNSIIHHQCLSRVLVHDSSSSIRRHLLSILDATPGVESVGSAYNIYFARELIKLRRADVLLLGKNTRIDNGLSLDSLMRCLPIPIVVVSGLTNNNPQVEICALAFGAIVFVDHQDKYSESPSFRQSLANAFSMISDHQNAGLLPSPAPSAAGVRERRRNAPLEGGPPD